MKRAWRGKSERRLQARELRENLTRGEQILWSHLRSCALGVKFRQQHPIGGLSSEMRTVIYRCDCAECVSCASSSMTLLSARP